MSAPGRDQVDTDSPYVAIGTVSGSLVGDTTGARQDGQPINSNKRQYIAAFAATMGNLVMGTAIAWSGPAIPYLKLDSSKDGFNISDAQGSWIGSLMPLGALIGGPLGGVFVGKVGKKGTMFISAALFTLSYLLLVVAPNVATIYFGRLMSGTATGIASLVCPVYVAEVAKPEVRGLLGSCVQLMVTLGVLLVLVVGAGLSWRWISICCLASVLVWAILLLFIPESPAQYMTNKKYREARESLEWLRQTIYVESEFEAIQREIEESLATPAKPSDLFQSQNLAPLIISMYLMLGQQLCGINAVIFYVVDIFSAAGSSIKPSIESIIIGIMQVVSTGLGAAVMDKLGRRFLLTFSSSIMVLSISSLGAFFFIKINQNNVELATSLEILPVISLCVFIFAFSVGFGPIPWLMMSELFSPKMKGLASSLATSINWTLAFCVTKFFSDLVGAISEAFCFWLFGGITALTFIFCLLFVPETKGKTLEQVQGMFRSSRPYFLHIGIWKIFGSCSGSSDSEVLVQADQQY